MVGVLLFLVREPTKNLKRQPLLALRHGAKILPPPSVSSLAHRLPVDLIIKHNEFVMAYPVRKDELTYAHAYSCVFPHTDHRLLLQEFAFLCSFAPPLTTE